jgi:predicted NBD/HSP70 family sugar kinase
MNRETLQQRIAWIAVALATAIRLFAPPAVSIPAAVLAFVLAIPAGKRARIAGVALLLVGAIDLTTALSVRRVTGAFAERSKAHLGREAEDMQRQIAIHESRLQNRITQVAAAVANRDLDRRTMFRTLGSIDTPAGSGLRLLTPNNDVLAWSGDELRVNGALAYAYDATNLYVTVQRTLSKPALVVQAFERIPNATSARSVFDPDDDWLESSVYHAGVMRPAAGVTRAKLATRGDTTLYVDMVPRTQAEVAGAREALGRSVAAIVLALAALVLLTYWWSAGAPLIATIRITSSITRFTGRGSCTRSAARPPIFF